MSSKHLALQLSNGIRLVYREQDPPQHTPQIGTIVLIHGFPQTSYQFRHAVPILAAKGYRCIPPDYREAGGSSKPFGDFTKATMADDIMLLLQHLGIETPVHLVGHDIGGMVAFAFAQRYPSALNEADVDHYTAAYSQSGAIRCGLGVYRAFEQDAEENRKAIERDGKVKVPTMVLSGELSRHRHGAEKMILEVTEAGNARTDVVEGAAHYLAEENPQGFADMILDFVAKPQSGWSRA